MRDMDSKENHKIEVGDLRITGLIDGDDMILFGCGFVFLSKAL